MLVLHHVTYSINSLCHFFGRRRFATEDHSRNLLWLAPFSFGEAWHNNHHAFPTSAFHGMGRRELDLSGLVIAGLERARPGVGRAADQRRAAGGQGALTAATCTAPAVRRATIAAHERARSAPDRPPLTPGAAGRGAGCRRSPPGFRSANTHARCVRRLAFLTAVLLAAIWALDGQGYFWPAWAWLGLRRPRAARLQRGLGLAPATRGRAPRRLRVGAGGRGGGDPRVHVAADLAAGRRAARSGRPGRCSGSATAGSAYSLIALHDRVLVARGRRALRARIDMLTRTRRQAVDAQAAELRRIERDLHDGAQARLVALTLQLGRAELRVQGQPEIRGLILDAQREAHHAIAELRDLARGIVPPLLADRGLVAAVESLAARYGLGTAIEADTHRLPRAGGRERRLLRDRRGADEHRQARPCAAQLDRALRDGDRTLVVRRRRRRARWRRPARVGARRPARAGGGARRQPAAARAPKAEGTLLEVRLPCG